MVDTTEDFILYGSLACHLCEQAEALLLSLQVNFTKVEITDEEALVEAYGVHIPVLKRKNDGKELFWPFGRERLQEFLLRQPLNN